MALPVIGSNSEMYLSFDIYFSTKDEFQAFLKTPN